MEFAPRRVAVVAALLSVGCRGISEPTEMRLATIQTDAFDVSVTVPQSVESGVAFEVVVFGYDGGCWVPTDTDVAVVGAEAIVSPRVRRSDSPSCPSVGRFDEHRASIAFEQAGVASVSFRGRSDRKDGTEEIEVEFMVVVSE